MSDWGERLRQLSDGDLIGATNKLTFKRALKIAKDARVLLDGEVIVGEHRCSFPSGSLRTSACTCPSRSLCVHRVAAILALRDGDGLAPQPAGESDAWTPAAYPDEELRGPGYDAAVRMMHEGLEVERESQTSVLFPALAIRVRYFAHAPLAEAVCSCREAACLHRVAGALSFRAELPALPDAKVRAFPLQRLEDLLAELVESGLDGMPLRTIERLHQHALMLVGDGLHGAARDVRALASTAEADRDRSSGFSPNTWLYALSRLALRVQAMPTARGRRRQVLIGEGHMRRATARKLQLVGVGASAAIGATGITVTSYFADRRSGELLRCVQGRRTGASTLLLFDRAELWPGLTARDLVSSAFTIHGPALGSDGSLSGGRGRVAHSRPNTLDALLNDVAPLLSIADVETRWKALSPPLLRESHERLHAIIALDTAHVPRPEFDPGSQRLRMRLVLRGGGSVLIDIPFSTAREKAIETLELWPYFASLPTHLFGQIFPTPNGWQVAPIALWQGGTAFQLMFGDRPLLRAKGRAPTELRPTESTAPVTKAAQIVAELLSQMAGIAVGGTRERWRLDVLRSTAAHARSFNAARLLRFADSPQSELAGATMWLTLLDESLSLRALQS